VKPVLVYLKSGVGSTEKDSGCKQYTPSFICTQFVLILLWVLIILWNV